MRSSSSLTEDQMLQILWLDEQFHSSKATPSSKALRSSVASSVGRLLRQLHARNSRRLFVSRDAFSAGAEHHAAHFLQKVHNLLASGTEPFERDDPVWMLLK